MGGHRETDSLQNFKDGVLKGTMKFSLSSLVKVKCAVTQALPGTY